MKSELNTSDMRYVLGERDELEFNQADVDFYDKLLDGFNRLNKKPAVIIGGDHFHRNPESSNLFEDMVCKAGLLPSFQSDIHISQFYGRCASGGRRVGRTFTNEITEKFIGEYRSFFDPMTQALGELSLVINARLNPKRRKAYTKVKKPNVLYYVGTESGSTISNYEMHGIATSISLMQELIDEILGVTDES